ncbi:MAG TPA: hypothetical protein VG013_13225 [Gemmataceae bacterium]|jgi:hypothetical protein|nr:hypothetical protein [Gemmataceae bacterium]
MRRPWAFLLVLGIVLAGGCCCQNCDLVESELRSREEQVRELHDELHRTKAYNQALQRELTSLRHTSAKITPEAAAQIYTVQRIALGFLTGGYDEDGHPGDEALQVVLEPRDPDGNNVKAPGALRVTVLQVRPEGGQAPLGSWTVSPDQLRRKWHSGLFNSGYFVVLPWKIWPSSPSLRVVAQFALADGRVFEADKDVTVRLPPEGHYRPRSLAPAGAVPAPAQPESPLPAPRPLESGPALEEQASAPDPTPRAAEIQPACGRQVGKVMPLSEAVQMLRPMVCGNPSP